MSITADDYQLDGRVDVILEASTVAAALVTANIMGARSVYVAIETEIETWRVELSTSLFIADVVAQLDIDTFERVCLSTVQSWGGGQ